MADLPEAPASTNTRVQTPNGYQWQITMRTETVSELIKQIKLMEAKFATEGWKVPDWQKEDKGGFKKKYEPDYVEGRACPTCGEKLINTKKQDGTPYVKCSTNKWDRIAKKATGCPYVEWDSVDKATKAVTSSDEEIPDPTENWEV